jgi:hypothetical protein
MYRNLWTVVCLKPGARGFRVAMPRESIVGWPDRQDARAVAYRTAGQALLAEALRAIEQAGLK